MLHGYVSSLICRATDKRWTMYYFFSRSSYYYSSSWWFCTSFWWGILCWFRPKFVERRHFSDTWCCGQYTFTHFLIISKSLSAGAQRARQCERRLRGCSQEHGTTAFCSCTFRAVFPQCSFPDIGSFSGYGTQDLLTTACSALHPHIS